MIEAKVVSVAPTYDAGQSQPLTQTTGGRLRTESAIAAGSALVGSVSIDQTTAGTTNAVTVNASGNTVGTLNGGAIISAANNNAQVLLGTTCRLYGVQVANNNAAFRYVKLYNKATSPAVGTDTPVMVIGVPPTSAMSYNFMPGISFGTGLALAIGTNIANTDTSTGANEVVFSFQYKS